MSSAIDRNERVSRLFAAALEQGAEERSAWLRDACGGDRELERELLELLVCDGEGFAALDAAVAAAHAPGHAAEAPPRIAGFRVLRRLGAGGMGAVFEAEQEHPRRRLALKILSPGLLATEEGKRRFLHEARVLGRLSHEGIARIHHAGFCEEPVHAPYYAMELVEGESLLRHAASRELDLRQRVALLARIADAVQHAHQHGVIHRDLKPSNLLVTTAGEPKVLDFGIARDLERESEGTLLTSAGQVLGTLGYMSPEQARGDADVDTRTDVYALGVVLYELLSSSSPHDLRGRGLTEAARILQDEEPVPLGARNAACCGDLETIASKALAKERERRYEGAGALAADLRRYLAEEPIAARPPSTLYHLRKFARRRRALVSATIAAALALILGSAVALAFAWRAADEAERATAAASRASDEAARADRERDRAQQEARTSERFMTFIIETLKGVDPAAAAGEEPTLREAMDEIASRMDRGLADEPWLRGRLFGFLGGMYDALGEPQIALEQLEKAARIFDELGDDHDHALEARLHLATRLNREGRGREALDIARYVLSRFEERGEKVNPTRANALLTLGEILFRGGEAAAALPHLEESLDLRRRIYGKRDDEEMAVGLLVASQALMHLERYGEAETLSRACLEMRRRLYTAPHPLIAESLQELGHIAWEQQRLDDAAPLLEDAVRQREQTLPPQHPAHVNGIGSLASLAEARGEHQAAFDHVERATALLRENWSDEHPAHVGFALQAARLLVSLKRPEEAETRARAVIERLERDAAAGRATEKLDHAWEVLGAALQFQRRWTESEAALRRALALQRASADREMVIERRFLDRLIAVLEAQGRSADAALLRDERAALDGTGR